VNEINIDLDRVAGTIDRQIFGGFAEHLGRTVYGGLYDPESPRSDGRGFRTDVLEAIRRLRIANIRYPGGNFVSGYRWMDGVGPRDQRPVRRDLAWHKQEPNTFGTNEFVEFCRLAQCEPYLVVNCGDGDMREAQDWVEYCNSGDDTALTRLRAQHGYPHPHRVKYWGIGNEVDGHWQIGYKTAQEYARAFTEFAKVMKWQDPDIRLIASANCVWHEDAVRRGRTSDWAERAQLLLEQAGDLVDYMAIHWYVGMGRDTDDFAGYMALSELFEERLTAYEGIIRAIKAQQGVRRPIYIAVDEWGTIPLTPFEEGGIYSLEDALVVAMQLNAFIRHAAMVRMADITMIVNGIGPILTQPDDILLQAHYYPFELYSRSCGDVALDVFWQGDTFDGGPYTGVRTLDVSASLDRHQGRLALFVVNRSPHDALEAEISLARGRFATPMRALVVNGESPKAMNTFDDPHKVGVCEFSYPADGPSWQGVFEPHSVTVLTCQIAR